MHHNILEQGTHTWADIAQTLNGIIQESGPIDINNKQIWNGYLHRWGNREWGNMLAAMGTLLDEHPSLAQPFHHKAWAQARDAWLRDSDTDARCMDSKVNKKYAWKAIMAMRELYNTVNNLHIPNQ